MIDPDGYRPNVGMVLLNQQNQVFWARRARHDGWQFPQGGIRSDETPEEAMYRELTEETGLRPQHVKVIASTPGWLRYRLPKRYLRSQVKPICLGQKQVWFLLQFLAEDSQISLEGASSPEFDSYRWVDYWYPAQNVIAFKRQVYQKALSHFESVMDSPAAAG